MFTITLLGPAIINNDIEQFGFNYSGPGTLSNSNFDFTGMSSTWSYGGSANMDGFGAYSDSVSFSAGTGDNPLVFTISGITGDTVNDYVNPGTGGQPNAGGNFAAKISSEKAGAFLGQGTQYVPIPAAVWLFGSGLLGLVGIARRKKTA